MYGPHRTPRNGTAFAVHHVPSRSSPYTTSSTVFVHTTPVYGLRRSLQRLHLHGTPHRCTVFTIHDVGVRSSPYTTSIYVPCRTPHPYTVFIVHHITVRSLLYTSHTVPHATPTCTLGCTPGRVRSSPYTVFVYGLRRTPHIDTVFAVHYMRVLVLCRTTRLLTVLAVHHIRARSSPYTAPVYCFYYVYTPFVC